MNMLGSGTLVDNLREVMPPLAHRLALLEKLNKAVARVNIDVSSDNIDVPMAVDEDGSCSITLSGLSTGQVKCTLCSYSLRATWVDIWRHLRYVHLLKQTQFHWKCPFCLSTLIRFRNFKIHTLHHLSQLNNTQPIRNQINSKPNLTEFSSAALGSDNLNHKQLNDDDNEDSEPNYHEQFAE